MTKNTLTMAGRLARCWLFTYRTPAAQAQSLLPSCLEAVSLDGCAFWNIVVCEIRSLRPKYLPAITGMGYRHAAYRLHARFHPPSGPPREGLYFLRSECDSALLTGAGNLLTDYCFHSAGIHLHELEDGACLRIDSPDAPANACIRRQPVTRLTSGSPFRSLQDAAERLPYPPRALSVTREGLVNVVEIQRNSAEWNPQLVEVETAYWSYFAGMSAELELCYEVAPLNYEWTRGALYPALTDFGAEKESHSPQLMECGFF